MPYYNGTYTPAKRVFHQEKCCTCMTKSSSTMYVPCGHAQMCQQCHKELMLRFYRPECPTCRVVIEASIDVRELVIGGNKLTAIQSCITEFNEVGFIFEAGNKPKLEMCVNELETLLTYHNNSFVDAMLVLTELLNGKTTSLWLTAAQVKSLINTCLKAKKTHAAELKQSIIALIQKCNGLQNKMLDERKSVFAIKDRKQLEQFVSRRGVDVLSLYTDNRAQEGIHEAVLVNWFDGVTYVIANDVDVNAQNENGATPLIVAVRQKDIDGNIIESLLANGCTIDHCDNDNLSALDHAIQSGARGEIVSLLLDSDKVLCNQGHFAMAIQYDNMSAAATIMQHQRTTEHIRSYLVKCFSTDVNCMNEMKHA